MASDSLFMRIREINPESLNEITLVACRMQQTLIEVLGEEKGKSLYSMDWLVDRVWWHLNKRLTTAKIFLAESENGTILGHAIARIEKDNNEQQYGYFSTIFVEPASRSKGIAENLILHVEDWLMQMKISKIIYNTDKNHLKIIKLFGKHNYEITFYHQENGMIQLTKIL